MMCESLEIKVNAKLLIKVNEGRHFGIFPIFFPHFTTTWFYSNLHSISISQWDQNKRNCGGLNIFVKIFKFSINLFPFFGWIFNSSITETSNVRDVETEFSNLHRQRHAHVRYIATTVISAFLLFHALLGRCLNVKGKLTIKRYSFSHAPLNPNRRVVDLRKHRLTDDHIMKWSITERFQMRKKSFVPHVFECVYPKQWLESSEYHWTHIDGESERENNTHFGWGK